MKQPSIAETRGKIADSIQTYRMELAAFPENLRKMQPIGLEKLAKQQVDELEKLRKRIKKITLELNRVCAYQACLSAISAQKKAAENVDKLNDFLKSKTESFNAKHG